MLLWGIQSCREYPENYENINENETDAIIF